MLHCRMLDGTAQLQQEALGILGVNLVHGALSKPGQHYQVLAGLMDDLGRSRIEVPFTCIYTQHATCSNGLQFMPSSYAMQPPHTYTCGHCTVWKKCGVHAARRKICVAFRKAPIAGCQASQLCFPTSHAEESTLILYSAQSVHRSWLTKHQHLVDNRGLSAIPEHINNTADCHLSLREQCKCYLPIPSLQAVLPLDRQMKPTLLSQ